MVSARAPLSEELVEPLVEAARHFGIEAYPAEVAVRGAVWGAARGLDLALGVRFVGGQPAGYAHFAEAPDPVLGPITVEPWSGQARGRQIVSDARTDAAIAVHGEPPAVLAWLDAPTRERVVALFEPVPRPLSLSLARRRITFRGPETMSVTAARMIADAEALLELAEGARLSGRSQLERVVHNALEDPEPEVRERNAAVLTELMPTAGVDARYGAAARLLFTDHITIDHRLDVLRLVRGLPRERVAPLMHRVLEEGPIELVRRAVSWAKEGAGEPTVRHLVRVLRRFEEPSLARGVVEALAEIGDARVQPALLNLLEREDDALRREVVRALGRVGSMETISQIEPFTKGLFTDRELKRVAREATQDIEARHSGVYEIPKRTDET